MILMLRASLLLKSSVSSGLGHPIRHWNARGRSRISTAAAGVERDRLELSAQARAKDLACDRGEERRKVRVVGLVQRVIVIARAGRRRGGGDQLAVGGG